MKTERKGNQLIFTIENQKEADELNRQLTYAQRHIGCTAYIASEIDKAFHILFRWEEDV